MTHVPENIDKWSNSIPLNRHFWETLSLEARVSAGTSPVDIQFHTSPGIQPSFPNETLPVMCTQMFSVPKKFLALLNDKPFQTLWKASVFMPHIVLKCHILRSLLTMCHLS